MKYFHILVESIIQYKKKRVNEEIDLFANS